MNYLNLNKQLQNEAWHRRARYATLRVQKFEYKRRQTLRGFDILLQNTYTQNKISNRLL